MSYQRVLWVRESAGPLFPVGQVYLIDALHRTAPDVEQYLLDLAPLPSTARRREVLRVVGEWRPDVVMYAWRDLLAILPSTEDPDTLELALKSRYSRKPADLAMVVGRYLRKRLGYEYSVYRNLQTVREIRSRFPHVKVFLGGPVAALYADHLARSLPEGIHFVRGEGEWIVPELVRGAELDYDCLVWREGPEVRHGTRPTPVFPVEDMPPLDLEYLETAFPRLPYYRDKPIGVQTKRGCAQRCVFCNSRLLEGPRLRYRSHDTVLADIKALRDYGARRFWFADSQFISTDECAKRNVELLERLAAADLGITWSGYIRIDRADERLCRALVRSGLDPIELSMTTGAQTLVDRLKLGFRLEDFFRGCERLAAAGYEGAVIVNYSLNAPGETPETLLETTESFHRLQRIFGAHRVRPEIFYLGITPDTELARYAVETGYAPMPSPKNNPLKITLESARYDVYDPPPLGRTIGKILIDAYNRRQPAARYLLDHLPSALASEARSTSAAARGRS